MTATETVSQILNAAGEVFASKGFKETTVREICAAADANVASINYHFGDKERLYIETVKHAKNSLEAAVPLPEQIESVDPENALRLFIETLAHRVLNPEVESWKHELLVREFMNPSKACQEMMEETIHPFMGSLHGILGRLMSENTPHYVIQQLAFSVISQCVYYRLQNRLVTLLVDPKDMENYYSPKMLAEHIYRFSVAAIRSYQSTEINT